MVYERVNWEYQSVDMTPEKAREMLATSKGNRHTSERAVHRYARDMRLGHWDCAGDGMHLTMYDGVLMDGHHRLLAIIEANMTIPGMQIRRPSNKPKCFDLNKVRSAKDIIDMDNGINGKDANPKIISMVKFIWEYVFHIKNSDRATEFDVKDYYEDHDELLTQAHRLKDYRVKGTKAMLSNSAHGVAVYAALRAGVSYEVLERFCHVVTTGYYDSESETAAIALRNLLFAFDKTPMKEVGGSNYRKFLCGITQKAIMDFNNKVRRKTYKVNDAITCYTDLIQDDAANYVIPQKTEAKDPAENSLHENVKKDLIKKDVKTGKVFITLPLNDKSEYAVTMEKVNEYKELYPAVNIEQELRNMRGWSNGNPTKRKTRSGIERFINSWLSRTQNGYHKEKIV